MVHAWLGAATKPQPHAQRLRRRAGPRDHDRRVRPGRAIVRSTKTTLTRPSRHRRVIVLHGQRRLARPRDHDIIRPSEHARAQHLGGLDEGVIEDRSGCSTTEDLPAGIVIGSARQATPQPTATSPRHARRRRLARRSLMARGAERAFLRAPTASDSSTDARRAIHMTSNHARSSTSNFGGAVNAL